jgi:2,4-dienoyl-CoA reductase-like NADH-dependent reductase (Old Yellow Enzyme family)/thioredoxin reductase
MTLDGKEGGTGMSQKYLHLLSPKKVGNHIFKNRLLSSPSDPHFGQGTEQYPAESLIIHYANKAKNGAALVTCSGARIGPALAQEDPLKVRSEHPSAFNPERPWFLFGNHFFSFDLTQGPCQNYIAQLAEAIHFHGAIATMHAVVVPPPEYDVSTGIPSLAVFGDGETTRVGKEIPAELLEGLADQYALQAALLKEIGFDGVFLHMAYRRTILGRFLSPLTNRRKDQFGGSPANRARFPLMVVDRIKQKCGKDFIIEASMSGRDPLPGEKLLCETGLPAIQGVTLKDAVEYAKMFAGHVDLLMMKAPQIDLAHPTGFNPERTPFIDLAEAVKKSGADVMVVTSGGYQDLDACEEIIASGKADFIGMARSWITNPDYGRKAYEGRNEDVVPCLRCNACHVSSYFDPWSSTCAVNPTWGIEHRLDKLVSPPEGKKKVAVVGGGVAGMEAALIAAGRGHEVTLYEKSEALGGLLKTTDKVSFKWPQKDFKNYLVRQISKAKIRVYLKTEATPDMLKAEEYDVVLAAVGSEPNVPQIPGVKGKNVMMAVDVYGQEDKLAKNVVVIGGGEVGVETGMHLAEKGHQVTVLEMTDMLARNSIPIHFYSMFRDAWEKLENFKFVLDARCTGIGAGKVTYLDKKGQEHSLAAGSVVIAAGMKPKSELALKFYGAGDCFYLIGDCKIPGNVQKAMRSAFSTASNI